MTDDHDDQRATDEPTTPTPWRFVIDGVPYIGGRRGDLLIAVPDRLDRGQRLRRRVESETS